MLLSGKLISDSRKLLNLKEMVLSFLFYQGDWGNKHSCPVVFLNRIIEIIFQNLSVDFVVADGRKSKSTDVKKLFFIHLMV